MLSSIPTIGIRFDIGKVNSGSYGIECWKIFWRAIKPTDLGGVLLYEGDTASTLDGHENVFCIAVQSWDDAVIRKVRSALSDSMEFKRVCSDPMIVDGSRCISEPLPSAGKVDTVGNIVGDAWNSKPALDAIKNQP